jgi:iron complex transport system ATP-binding protein
MRDLVSLVVEGLESGYDGKPVISGITLSVYRGEIVSILGPNGAGKTTLLRCIEGTLSPSFGNIYVSGKELKSISDRERGRIIASVPQIHRPIFPFTVLEVVLMGRNPYITEYGTPSKRDYEIAENVLKEVGIYELRDRYYTELSGGELQLTLIARALAQEPEVILFDEPTAHLDFKNQLTVLSIIRKIVEEKEISILMVMHDPNLAMLYSDRVFLMEKGRIMDSGKPVETITPQNMKRLYGFDVEIVNSNGRYFILPPENL